MLSVHDLPAATVGAEQALHLILPFAASQSDAWWPCMQNLRGLDNVQALLRGMQVVARDSADARSLSPPHERLLARELGLAEDDGLLPWAALARASQGPLAERSGWGFVTLCHWAMGREHATLSDPQALQVRDDESRELMAAMRPFFEEDGLKLHPLTPTRWLVEGAAMAQPTASLDRVLGRNVDPWLPSAQDARLLRRLQNEMQMLLYPHPVNEARQQRRELAINSLWFSGTGSLAGATRPPCAHMPRELAQAALAEDWVAYAQAWAELDATVLARLRQRQQAGQTVRLSLCGERGSVTLETAPGGLMARLRQLGRRPAWPALLKDL